MSEPIIDWDKYLKKQKEITQQRDDLLTALKENYEFTKYAAANKKLNTDEYMEAFFPLCESAQEIAKAAIEKGK